MHTIPLKTMTKNNSELLNFWKCMIPHIFQPDTKLQTPSDPTFKRQRKAEFESVHCDGIDGIELMVLIPQSQKQKHFFSSKVHDHIKPFIRNDHIYAWLAQGGEILNTILQSSTLSKTNKMFHNLTTSREGC